VKLSTRTRYGIRALLELAGHFGNEPLQLKAIARCQDISVKYLEQIMIPLKVSGIVRSVMGSKGGYLLDRSPNQIKVSECFSCLEGPMIITECLNNMDYCEKTADCITRGVWAEIEIAIMSVLDSLTLQDLLDRAKNRESINYDI